MPLLFVLLSYLLGTFPSAYLAGYLSTDRDIRLMGDHNMGAQNAYAALAAAGV
ncbi:MAG: glycerol-3-phosphate acyltransferase [Dehalococcoides mccartyi]|nr:glycerol-3-phosphate acyltransferase [Dehalococcoides mccartyi]MBF4481880.1 glycerol-3-phosphate acyltransferase [Dehalococcoides mccartyi]MBJ7531236.1 glycerol-3-phosphate acyltransferase [Dehalococcoides mccartyi]